MGDGPVIPAGAGKGRCRGYKAGSNTGGLLAGENGAWHKARARVSMDTHGGRVLIARELTVCSLGWGPPQLTLAPQTPPGSAVPPALGMSCSHLSTGPGSAETGPPVPAQPPSPCPVEHTGTSALFQASGSGGREDTCSDLLAIKPAAPPFLPSRAT